MTVSSKLMVVSLCAGAALAQTATGTFLGEVRDESAALAPLVKVTARHEATGFSRSVLTGPEGVYRIDDLLPGRYTLSAEKAGFQRLSTRAVELEVNQKARVDLRLRVGPERESVTVTAEVSPLEADDASASYRLSASAIRGLPLDVRNVVALVTLGPGAIPRQLGGFGHDVVNDVQEARGAVALNPPINGARSTMNTFLLDGALNTDLNTRAIAVKPPLESVQEFRIQSSLVAAEFPQAGGGVADLVTRTGGRQFHGSAFEYFRNEAADARNFFDDPELPRPVFRQSQFGGSLGGPLPLPASFFFATYEGMRARFSKPQLQIVPDAQLRSGDFGGSEPIFDPLSRLPFPDNRIPAARIDPIARTFLDRYQPLPNRTAATSNYLDGTPNEFTNDNLSVRIDRQFRDESRVFGRYTLNEERNRLAGAFPERPSLERVRAQQGVFGHSLAGRSWLHEARFSFTRLRVFSLPESAFRTDDVRELGITGIPGDPFNFGLPFFVVTNFSMVTDTPTRPQTQRDNLWHFSEGVSLARGRHNWKLGFQWVRFTMGYRQSRLARGQFTFTGIFTAAAGSGGDAFADFLLGFPQITTRNVGSGQAYLVQNIYSGYLQDHWRVSRRLTLNFGARYEYAAPLSEQRGGLLNLDYSTLPAAPRLTGVRRAVEPDRNNLAPQAGLAWRLGATVFRAGYGFHFSPEIAVETYDLVRNGIRNETNQTDGTRPLLTLRNGFPQTSSTGFPSYFGLDPRARTGYVQHRTAGFQRQLPGGLFTEVAYVGSKGTSLGRFRTFNTPLRVVTGENLPPRPGDLQALRPFPELGKIIQRQHIAKSSYHSLQLRGEKRMPGSVALQASFVWSKSIDDADSVISGLFDSVGAQDERNLRLERGLSFFHVGRRISAGFVWQLPPWLARWELSGILTLQDGTPLNPVYFAYDGANSGTPNRPDVVPGQQVRLPRSQRSADRFFDTDAFRDPRPFTFGSAGRNILPGPGNNLLDLSLHRRFPAGEGRTIEFRAEFFNLFNHPNFGIPGPFPDFGPFFGKIFSTGDPRRLQLAVRFDF